jgi:hypothetical protein
MIKASPRKKIHTNMDNSSHTAFHTLQGNAFLSKDRGEGDTKMEDDENRNSFEEYRDDFSQ